MARGGGGGSRNNNRGPLPRDVQISKKISWLLRHGAAEEGLQLGPGGYLSVQEVLNNRKIRSLKVSFAEVRQIVQENDKQRFTMVLASSLLPLDEKGEEEDSKKAKVEQEGGEQEQSPLPSDDPKDYLIRANQGHSLKVEDEGLLQPITTANLPQTAIHGTTHAAWTLIVASGGLKPMGRNHVHFAAGLPAGFTSVVDAANDGGNVSAPVVSGMRKSSTILMFLDVAKAVEGGMKLWLSDNGVILSEGNAEGIVPLEVFERVEDRTGEGVLLVEGKIVKEPPAKWASKGNGRS